MYLLSVCAEALLHPQGQRRLYCQLPYNPEDTNFRKIFGFVRRFAFFKMHSVSSVLISGSKSECRQSGVAPFRT